MGDRCGKTRLRREFANFFPNYLDKDRWRIHKVPADGENVEIDFWQNGYPHDYTPFEMSHVVLICFAVNSLETFNSVVTKWAPYADEFCPSRRIILVCCKKDLRDTPLTLDSSKFIKAQQGIQLAKQISAYRYVECSSKTGEGVKELLEHAARLSKIPVTPQSPTERQRARDKRLGTYDLSFCVLN
ncbi:P-loop containing nucleoside triphosphate hydrolase protein [Zopfochytrium polystomum]|nr:P-loop containing nucleoside triphosphate hydrolase protein [Zopfochytrium polystomum]